MIELYVRGQAVDIAPNTKITLNFNSNIFGDISKITPSNSLTINLPKTPKNESIFGMAMNTTAPYRRWNAKLYVNGVEVVKTAYLIMLSVSDTYEVALYWGVVTSLQTLKDSGKTLADINDVLSIQYGGDNWWEDWVGKKGTTQGGATSNYLINAKYSVGDIDLMNDTTARAQAALLPSVRVAWLFSQIVKDNGLNVSYSGDLSNSLMNLMLPFTTHKVNEALNDKCVFLKNNYRTTSVNGPYTGKSTFYGLQNEQTPHPYREYVLDEVELKMNNRNVKFDALVYRAKLAHTVTLTLQVTAEQSYEVGSTYAGFEWFNEDGLLKGRFVGQVYGVKLESKSTFDMSEGDYIVPTVETIFRDIKIQSSTMFAQTNSEELDQDMGGMINTRDNLPAIKQLDFVKDICAIYGLWATLVGDELWLLPYDVLYGRPAVDWSHKLVGTSDYDASNTTYTLSDFAQRNILTYKKDDTVTVDASGALIVDNETLDKEKEMLTLTFAPSDGNIIPHLKWKDEKHTEVEEQKVEPRIMLFSSLGGNLNFSGLDFDTLIQNNYRAWQKIMRNPIVIEENVMLSEIDIKELDYRNPIYLQKYGAYFAIDKVQWSEGEASTVTFVKLPTAQEIGVALPYKVTAGVAVGTTMKGYYETNPDLAYIVSGSGEYFAEKATIKFDVNKGLAQDLQFIDWVTPAGTIISTDNPYVYDGSNGDLDIIAHTEEKFVIG